MRKLNRLEGRRRKYKGDKKLKKGLIWAWKSLRQNLCLYLAAFNERPVRLGWQCRSQYKAAAFFIALLEVYNINNELGTNLRISIDCHVLGDYKMPGYA